MHTSAYKQKQNDWISNVSKSNNRHIQCISIFKMYFLQSRQHISFKTEVKIIKFFLNIIRMFTWTFKNVLRDFLEYWVKKSDQIFSY